MKLVNTSSLDTKTLRRELYRAAKWAGVSLRGVYVQVNNGIRSRVNGRCYHGNYIWRNGNWLKTTGYIKLFVHPGRTLEDTVDVFVHELSHLVDLREYRWQGRKVPRSQERRAEAMSERWKSTNIIANVGEKVGKDNLL